VRSHYVNWERNASSETFTVVFLKIHVLWDVMLCYVMLCYVMLCYVMLCYVMLCYVMLCYFMLCYVMLCYVMLCYVMLCYVMLCYVMLCYVMLCYVMLCYVMLCYVMNLLHLQSRTPTWVTKIPTITLRTVPIHVTTNRTNYYFSHTVLCHSHHPYLCPSLTVLHCR